MKQEFERRNHVKNGSWRGESLKTTTILNRPGAEPTLAVLESSAGTRAGSPIFKPTRKNNGL